jgi:hypothetical protein
MKGAEEKEEFTGLKKVLERYAYLDDLINKLRGLSVQIDSYRSKVEFYIRRTDVPLKSKARLVELIREHRDKVKDITTDLERNGKRMDTPLRRLKMQRILEIVQEMFKKVDEYV